MTPPQIFRHALANNFGVCFKRIGVTVTHFRGDFKPDMNQLTQVGIIGRVRRVVLLRGHKLLWVQASTSVTGRQLNPIQMSLLRHS